MADDWIKMRVNLPTDPTVIAMSSRLGMDIDTVVGKLHRVWSWVDQQLRSCNAPGVTLMWLDAHVGAEGFANAMVEFGWLESNDDGISFPNYESHISKSAKNRALAARRVQRHRNASVTELAQQDRYQRKSKSKTIKNPLPPSSKKQKPSDWSEVAKLIGDDSSLSCGEFQEGWVRWRQHRVEIRKPLTATAVSLQIKRLEGMGLARAVAAIDHTIERGWTGLREPEDGQNGRGAAPSRQPTEKQQEEWAAEQRSNRDQLTQEENGKDTAVAWLEARDDAESLRTAHLEGVDNVKWLERLKRDPRALAYAIWMEAK